jgi:hypothetical protein
MYLKKIFYHSKKFLLPQQSAFRGRIILRKMADERQKAQEAQPGGDTIFGKVNICINLQNNINII